MVPTVEKWSIREQKWRTGTRPVRFGQEAAIGWLLIEEECWVRISSSFERFALNWGGPMQWTAPAFEEVCLNCEINSYVSAKL
jgi:coenzyme PQQ precursor peptide PqqA